MGEMVRVNTRIGSNANDWLDNYSKETGIPKSTLIHLAIEHYIQHKEAMERMADMGQIVEAIERLEKRLNNND
ncbi:TPA: ribbon-helix-helix domain-containing protein [Salmonella enterica subsp. enterica serovar Typhi str. AG3]|nr:ribbon-helix-helix domain-containing protein [Salmonella enterica subsp. enterica serovar Typhi str. AG3]